MTAAPADALATDQQLHQANDFNTNNEHHPLERTVCINIRASLSDLCLRADTATWAPPSAEATRSIFQQAPYGAWTNRHPNRNPTQRRRRRRRRRPYKLSSLSPAINPPTPPTHHTHKYTRAIHTRAAHCADRPCVGGVRSASSSTSAARPRTRGTSRCATP